MTDQNMSVDGPKSNLPVPVDIDGEARILDVDLALRLGFAKPAAIRDLIKRHKAALEQMGVLRTVRKTPDNKGLGGAPAKAYYLNKRQAIFITAKSETVDATEITIEVIERFDAYERGVQRPARIDVRDPATMATIALQLVEINRELQERVQRAEPRAQAYDEFISTDGLIALDDAAKALLGWSGIKLMKYLRGAGWVSRNCGVNTPNLWCIQQRVMAVRPTRLPGGKIYAQPMLTPKGMAMLRLAVRNGDLFLDGAPVAQLSAPAHA